MKKYVLLLMVLISVPVYAQNMPPAHHAPNREFHMVNLKLQLHFNMNKKEVFGQATEEIVPLRTNYQTVHLNAVGMHIEKVEMNGQPLKYNYDGKILSINLDHSYGLRDTLTYTVTYDTKPVEGLTFITPDKAYPNLDPEIWSQSECEDARYWYPCHDYPDDFSTSEIIATVPEKWQVISNGALKNVSVNPAAHSTTFDWVESVPHVVYLNSIIAGKFKRFVTHYGKTPIYFYSDPKYGDLIKQNFSREPDVLKFYSNFTGQPYAWEKLALTTVENFIWGGEENASAITLEDNTLHDKYADPFVNSTSLIAHESAHQWFGDLLTCSSWSQAWLNEGFATYFEAMYTQHAFGNDAFEYEMYHNHQSVITADNRYRKPTVDNHYYDPVDIFGTYIYPRGASALHMLRFVLGDSLFKKAIHYYVERYKHHTVDTHDFEKAIREATGYNLYWFFNEWLYDAGHPEFDISDHYDSNNHLLTMHVSQTQKVDSLTPVYRMPVDIYIVTPNQKIMKKVWVDSLSNTFHFKVDQQPLMVNFDQGHWLLDEVRFRKSGKELAYQLKNDQDVVGRMWAVQQLIQNRYPDAVNDAISAMEEDPFYGVRSRCADLLSYFHTNTVKKALIKAVRQDTDARVRVSAIQALSNFKGKDLVTLMDSLFYHQKNYYIRAAAVRSLAKIDPRRDKSMIEKAFKTPSYQHIIKSAALSSLQKIDPKKAYMKAEMYSRYGEPNNMRMEALRIMIGNRNNESKTLKYLKSYLNDPYIWVRNMAISGLEQLGYKSDIPLLKHRIQVEPDGRLRMAARRAIEALRGK